MSTTAHTTFVDQRVSTAARQLDEAQARLERAEAAGLPVEHARDEVDRAAARLGYWRAVAMERDAAQDDAGAPAREIVPAARICRIIGHTYGSRESHGWRIDECRRCGDRRQIAL